MQQLAQTVYQQLAPEGIQFEDEAYIFGSIIAARIQLC